MDYPGVVPYATSVKLIGRELTEDERSVRGVIVRGLTKSDFQLLDNFEGMASALATLSPHTSYNSDIVIGIRCCRSLGIPTGAIRPSVCQISATIIVD